MARATQINAAELLALLEADARYRAIESFEYFVRYIKPDFELQWFHVRICAEVQAWAEAPVPYVLILELPPGHAKSTYAQLAVAWSHARDAEDRVIYTSYGQHLAEEHCGYIQDVQLSKRYRDLCPSVRLNEKGVPQGNTGRDARRSRSGHDIIGHGGGVRAVGVGGAITGFRADKIIIDDPIKGPKEAASPATRNDQWQFYQRTLKTRRRPGRPLRFLILLTRWNIDDLAGRIQSLEENWKVVSFEALREDMDDPRDPREHGEALWPSVITADELETIRRLDAFGFSALYQQRPSPEGGTVIKTTWCEQRYTVLPLSGGGYWFMSMDAKAGSKDPESSRAVIQLWFRPANRPAELYLVDQRKGVWDQPETISELRMLSKLAPWTRASKKLVEDAADGKAVVATLRSEVPGLELVRPQGSKITRARAVAPYWAAGNIFLPTDDNAPWVGEFIEEITTFPTAAHDDQVDAMTLAVSHVFVTDGMDPMENLRRVLGMT